jgi:hypothetical protein
MMRIARDSRVRLTIPDGPNPGGLGSECSVALLSSFLFRTDESSLADGLYEQNATPHAAKVERTMSDRSYATACTVDQIPEEAFAAITDVRGWWSGRIAVAGDNVAPSSRSGMKTCITPSKR